MNRYPDFFTPIREALDLSGSINGPIIEKWYEALSKLPKSQIFTQADSRPLRWEVFRAGCINGEMLKMAQVNSNQKYLAISSRIADKAQAVAVKYLIASALDSNV